MLITVLPTLRVSRSISLLSPLVIPGLRTLSRLCSKKIKEAVVKLSVNSWNLDGWSKPGQWNLPICTFKMLQLLLLILAHVNSKLAALRLKFSHVFLYSPLQFNISNILLPLKLVSAMVRQCSASGSFLDHNVQHSRCWWKLKAFNFF